MFLCVRVRDREIERDRDRERKTESREGRDGGREHTVGGGGRKLMAIVLQYINCSSGHYPPCLFVFVCLLACFETSLIGIDFSDLARLACFSLNLSDPPASASPAVGTICYFCRKHFANWIIFSSVFHL